ncbi:MAG: chromosomal replication initiator protein DnaA [Chlamydiota bacterium]
MATITKQKHSWIDFLTFIKKRCNQAEYANWIAPIECLSCDDDGIKLETPNIFVQQYLLDNYKEALSAFLPTDHNGDPLITFVLRKAQPIQAKTPFKPKPKPHLITHDIKLNATYTFETFIEGPSNQFIKSAALGVASKPGKAYNPLFIHGGVGLGKTHLLHAIGHYSQKQSKQIRIQCISTEGFINDIVAHLRSKSIEKMKRFYRNLDILLVDDIQFLQNRLNFEEEFCNTFESLINQGKQIVLTSDKPPGQLKLSERMIARMEWGLVAQMSMPDLETRVAILQDKAEKKRLDLSNPLAFYIAEHIHNNVRQLEGAINRLSAYCRLMDFAINREVIDTTLGEMFQVPSRSPISVDRIIQSVAAMYDVSENDLRGKERTKEIAFSRQIAMYLAKELLNDSLKKIAAAFGGKTHSTLLHAWKKIDNQLGQDETLRRQILLMRQNIEV